MRQQHNIAVIAHDRKKPTLAAFLKEREYALWGRTIVATGRTAEFLEQEDFKVPLQHLSQGRSGGYVEITEMINRGEVDMVIFFRDPEVRQQYHQDILDLLESCNVNNLPLATNPASAELLIIGMIRKELSAKGEQKTA
ncbi:MAG: methylglyoxal synthase [Bacteroidota bacterium]